MRNDVGCFRSQLRGRLITNASPAVEHHSTRCLMAGSTRQPTDRRDDQLIFWQETAKRRRRHRPAWNPTNGSDSTRDGFPVVGSGGSRLLSGNSWYAEELENWIARFHKRPAALLFNSGYDANLGLMSCLPQPGDAVVCDELVHNSVRVRVAFLLFTNLTSLYPFLACQSRAPTCAECAGRT